MLKLLENALCLGSLYGTFHLISRLLQRYGFVVEAFLDGVKELVHLEITERRGIFYFFFLLFIIRDKHLVFSWLFFFFFSTHSLGSLFFFLFLSLFFLLGSL